MNGDTATKSARRIAILGSSGGNLRSHGGSDPARLIADVARQLEAAGFVLEEVQFVSAATSMDNVSQSTPATLWGADDSGPHIIQEGPLSEINALARQNDERLAARVRDGEIDGLILMSHDPGDTNAQTVAAAAAAEIPRRRNRRQLPGDGAAGRPQGHLRLRHHGDHQLDPGGLLRLRPRKALEGQVPAPPRRIVLGQLRPGG